MELRSRVVVVTGGASGIGRALCRRFAAYAVTKHAAVGFAEWVAISYGGRGIRFF